MIFTESCSNTHDDSKETAIMKSNSTGLYEKDSQVEIDLELCVPSEGLINAKYAIADGGCYELLANNDWSANILYSDFATKKRIYLSTDLSSNHHSVADTSWIENIIGGAFIFTASDYLFIETAGMNENVGVLYKADLNGENREKLLTFDEYSPFLESIACDKNYLYTLSTKNRFEMSIVKVNIQNGDIEELCILPENTAFLMSAFEDNLIIKTLSIPYGDESEDAIELFKKQEHIIYKYSISTGKLEEMLRWKQDEVFETYKDEKMYFLNMKNDSLNYMDMKSNEIQTLIPLLSEKGMDFGSISNVLPVYDNHLQFDLYGGIRLHMDLDTLELQQLEYMEEIKKHPEIIGEYNDFFLVTVDYLEIPFETYAPDGVTPIVNNYLFQNIAMINKDDYWNSNYKFERINNTFYGE